jgi:hypothetical protein
VAAIRAIDPEQPAIDIRTMGQVLDGRLASQRFSALLLGLFADAALLRAAVGIYSVLCTSCVDAAARSGSERRLARRGATSFGW